MKAIIYQSKSYKRYQEEELQEFASNFADNNKLLDVTGYLCYRDEKFFQYIEGDNTVVVELMNRIKTDSRHEVICCYFDEPLAKRRFPVWSMKYLNKAEIDMETLIDGHFKMIHRKIGEESTWLSRIWSCVEKVAAYQKRQLEINKLFIDS